MTSNLVRPGKKSNVLGMHEASRLSPEKLTKYKKLVQSGLSPQEAAQGASIPYARMPKILQKHAADALTELRLELYEALREHTRSNAPAAIFAAKAKLGWQDRQEVEQNQALEYIDLPSSESREAWQRRQQKRQS